MDINEFGEVDWLNLKSVERVEPTKLLYKALKAVSDITGREVDLLMDDAYGERNTTSPHYASNFRRGKIAAGKAMMIHKWLAENHFKISQTAATELVQFNPKSAWELFIEQHAQTEGLRVVPMKREMGILSRVKNAPRTVTTLRLGQMFCFELDSPINGVVVAFESHKGKWHPLPLGADDRQLRSNASKGVQLLPRDTDGHPIYLEELEDTGPHSYVFVVAPDRAFPASIVKIISVPEFQHEMNLFRARVNIVT